MSESTHYPIFSPNLKGYQHIDGVWFPLMWFTHQQCAQFILQYWFDACQLFVFEQGYLLRFPKPLGMHCEEVHGWPLVMQADRLCSMKVTQSERNLLPNSDIVLMLGYQIIAIYESDGEKINPAKWLKIDDYQLIDIHQVMIEQTVEQIDEYIDCTEEAKDLETIFGNNIPKSSKALIKFTQKNAVFSSNHIQKSTNTKKTKLWDNLAAGWPVVFIVCFFLWLDSFISNKHENKIYASIWDYIIQTSRLKWVLLGVFIAIISFLFSHFFRRSKKLTAYVNKKRQSSSSQNQTDNEIEEIDGGGRQNKQVKPQSWRKYLTHFAFLTQLHHLIAFRQSRYLDSMMKLFEDGNLDEALKYALPLNGESDSLSQQAFGVPKPRQKLSLTEICYGGRSVFIDWQIQERLNQLYRQSFEKLDKEKRIDEAVFVLIELLNNLNEGIDYLSKNQRHQQAIDVAIARDANPDLIVRLCCTADQWDKAIMIARRHHAFANAVTLLQAENPELADKLRLIWAQTLAEKAEWLSAINAIWPLKAHRYLSEKWFEYAESAGEFNADLIIQSFILRPNSLEKYREKIKLLQTDSDLHQERFAMAVSMLKYKKDIDNFRGVLQVLINAIIADVINHNTYLNQAECYELIHLSQDKALKADLPQNQLTVKRPESLAQDRRNQKITCATLGNRVIYDAVPLNNGQYLLALGEAGVILVDKTGKQQKYYRVTAHHFVLSYNRLQVLTLTKRENYFKVHKLDITNGQLTELGDMRFQHCLWNFDGINWTIVVDDCIRVIDVSQVRAVVWQVKLEAYRVLQSVSDEDNERWLLENQLGDLEEWNYTLPERRLLYRNSIEAKISLTLLNRQFSGVNYLRYSEEKQAILMATCWEDYTPIPIHLTKRQYKNSIFYFMKDFICLVIPQKEENGFEIYLYHSDTNAIKMTIAWPLSELVYARTSRDDIIIYDNKGRCTHINVDKNRVTHFTV